MKTDDLVALLAQGTVAVDPQAVSRRWAAALAGGFAGAIALMVLLLGVRPDFAEAAWLPMFWVKLAFPAALLAGALVAAQRLSRPGRRLGLAPAALAAPVAAIWLLATVALIAAPPEARADLVFGESWAACPYYIAILSAPGFAAALWAVRGLAPTRLVLAGAAAGLASGAAATLVYALHCPEMAAPFIGIWYLLGMLTPAAAGAVLGPLVLRW